MRFLPTEDQSAMAEAVHEALIKQCPPQLLRESWGKPCPTQLWMALADFGVFALTIDPAYGGLGLDERDTVGVLEETGWAGVPGPVVETLAVAYVLQASGSAGAGEFLAGIATGELTVSIGLDPDTLVLGADQANLLVLQRGQELHAVPASQVDLTQQESIDGNRRLFAVEWEPEPSTLLANDVQARVLAAGARNRLLVGTAAQLVGLGRQILDLSVKHVSIREQFGRPLGTLQAVQHRLADVAVAVDFAAPVVARAACSLAAGAPSSSRDAAMAKVFASEAGERAAYAALQVHGAIGYTREHDLHLYSMRAWTLALAYGDVRRHRVRVADELLAGESAPRYP